MNLCVIGTGYVGLVTGACFAEMGNEVVCVDIDAAKIEGLAAGKVSIYEPGLENLVRRSLLRGNLHFTTRLEEGLEKSTVVFIAVGTPMGEDGSADLACVLAVAEEIGRKMQRPLLVVDKSTVPVGTSNRVRAVIQDALDRRGSRLSFDVASNPEFLKEGAACNDFLKPDRIVVGTETESSLAILQELYAPFISTDNDFLAMDIRSAELTKYAANAMLATKISYINEIANICEHVGADVNMVRHGIGSDRRIGYQFIYPGCGYGGSCLPKDVKALVRMSEEAGYQAKLLAAVESVNEGQKSLLAQKVLQRFGEDLRGRCFAVWGLSFKPETGDMREAPAITVIRELAARGAALRAYDPEAMREAQTCYLKDVEGIRYGSSKYDVLDGADALLLLTEWKEFRSPDFLEMAQRMKRKLIFDGRNQYRRKYLEKLGYQYVQIGVR